MPAVQMVVIGFFLWVEQKGFTPITGSLVFWSIKIDDLEDDIKM